MKDRKTLKKDNTTIHQTNENCQVFNGPISGCVFALPGATVHQHPVQQVRTGDNGLEELQKPNEGLEEQAPESLRPGIFDTRIFDSDERLRKLRATIASAIDMGDATIMYGQPQALRIDPTVQSEWYYILKPIEEASITKGLADTKFVEQMVEWFPMLFPDESPEYFKEFKRKLLRSISAERTRWRKGKTKDVVCLREMWSKRIATMLGDAKANRVWEIAYQGLYTSLTKLKHEIERENNLGNNAV